MTEREELAAYSLADVVLTLYDSAYSSGVIARSHALGVPVVMTDVGDLSRQSAPTDAVVGAHYSDEELARAIARVLGPQATSPNLEPWQAHVHAVLNRV